MSLQTQSKKATHIAYLKAKIAKHRDAQYAAIAKEDELIGLINYHDSWDVSPQTSFVVAEISRIVTTVNLLEIPMVKSIVGGPAYRAGLMKELEEVREEIRESTVKKVLFRFRLVATLGRLR